MNPTTKHGGAPKAVGPAVVAQDLSRHYGDVKALNGVSFSVERGEFFALLGPNGAGKSTTMHILSTLVAPSGGSAAVMGFDVVRDEWSVRHQLGMVFQDPALDDRLTARENLEIHAALYSIPPQETRAAVDQALRWSALDEVHQRRVRTFSGGMKRRLELARALMHQPKVLFLDEPTIGLDPQGRRNLWEQVEDLRQRGMTVLMTTHNLPEAGACDRVGIIDHGKLIAIGSPQELIAQHTDAGKGDLEDVFINLTGRKLRDANATARDMLVNFANRGGELTR